MANRARVLAKKANTKSKNPAADPRMDIILKSIESGNFSHAEVLEILYLSCERDLFELMRSVIRMSPPARMAHQAFFGLLSAPDRISAVIDDKGRLILESPEVEQRVNALRTIEASDESSTCYN